MQETISRGLILNHEFVIKNNVKCEQCGEAAYATFYDKEWDSHEYCQSCYPKEKQKVELEREVEHLKKDARESRLQTELYEIEKQALVEQIGRLRSLLNKRRNNDGKNTKNR